MVDKRIVASLRLVMLRAVIALAGLFLACPAIGASSSEPRVPLVTTAHFTFFSDFDTHVNDALLAAGVARNFDRSDAFAEGQAADCLSELAPSKQHGWRLAVEWYAQVVSPTDWNDRPQYLLRMHLAGFEGQVDGARAREFLGIADGFLAAAAPAYRECRWPERLERTRRWVAALEELLGRYGEDTFSRLEEAYRHPLSGLPIPVDVVETVSWSGANSLFWESDGGHLLISSERYQGLRALEIVFHEASHQFMRPGFPVPTALYEASQALGIELPGDLWHVVLFYTTGETVRRVLDEVGQREYTPLLYGIFERGGWTEFRAPIEATWPAYLDGETSLDQAAINLLRAVSENPAERTSPEGNRNERGGTP